MSTLDPSLTASTGTKRLRTVMSTPARDSDTAPVATVVIPTHDRHEGLSALLDDLLCQQDLPSPLEVMVIDSAVPESAADVVDRAAARGLAVSYHLTENSLAAKRSLGATLASGDVVLFADDDMRLPPGWVRGHLDALGGRHHVISCGAVDFPPTWVATSNYYRFKQEWHRPPGDCPRLVLPAWRVVTMNMALSRELLASSAGWDKDFVHYGAEDVEWGLRMAHDHGASIVHSAEARAIHQEVRQDVVGFSRKLYLTAYHGHGLLLAKAEGSRSIPTLRVTEPGLRRTPAEWMLYASTSLAAWGWSVRALGRALRAVDARRHAYHAIPYRLLYLLSMRLGVKDRRAGRPDRSAEIA